MSLIWKTISPTEIGQWVAHQQSDSPPTAYKLLGPPSVQELLKAVEKLGGPFLEPFKSYIRIHPQSGAIDVRIPELPALTEEPIMALGVLIARALDQREAFEWRDLDDEEKGSPENTPSAVGKEFWLSINSTHPVGPGGRIVYYRRRRLLEIVVRRRRGSLGGYWRKPTEVADRVSSYLEIGQTPGIRLRAGFGYYEASKYESQSLLRPVFLFLLDRPTANEGPRWRIATVEAATEIPEFPATAGIDFVTGCV